MVVISSAQSQSVGGRYMHGDVNGMHTIDVLADCENSRSLDNQVSKLATQYVWLHGQTDAAVCHVCFAYELPVRSAAS